MSVINLINTAYAHGNESVGFDYGMMGDFGGIGMFGGALFMILFWLLVLFCIFVLIKAFGDSRADVKRFQGDKVEKVYICSECGFEYKENGLMVKCKKLCKEKNCNLDIIKHGKRGK